MNSHKIAGMERAHYLYELGKARSLSGNFLGSIRLLEESAQLYLSQKDYLKYMECQGFLLKLYKELKDFQKISALKEQLLDLIWAENIQMTARTRYILGQCALAKGDLKEALEEFEKSIHQIENLREKAEAEQDPLLNLQADIENCFTAYGLSSFYIRREEAKKAQYELKSLTKLLDSFKTLEKKYIKGGAFKKDSRKIKALLEESKPIRERIELAGEMLKYNILRINNNYVGADNLLWQCYEKVQKSKDLCAIVTFFYYLGQNYMNMQDYHQAGIFLNLAKKSIDSDNFKHLYSCVSLCIEKLKQLSSCDYDLIVNLATNSVTEKHKGRIDFKNQFILLDLLKMFLARPGAVCSKETMVERVWKQKYDPSIHDNKIYVTIKRLREVVEPDCRRPRYIFRGKDGYYLNGKMRVLLKDKPLNQSLFHREAVL